jgi:hypothetical protein
VARRCSPHCNVWAQAEAMPWRSHRTRVAGGRTAACSSTALCRSRILSGSAYPVSRNLNRSNRRMRTRLSGGVGGRDDRYHRLLSRCAKGADSFGRRAVSRQRFPARTSVDSRRRRLDESGSSFSPARPTLRLTDCLRSFPSSPTLPSHLSPVFGVLCQAGFFRCGLHCVAHLAGRACVELVPDTPELPRRCEAGFLGDALHVELGMTDQFARECGA